MQTETKQVESLGLKRKPLGEVPVNGIIESKFNPRRTFEEMEDLQASITRHGVISPLLLRSGSNGTFELVAGARRLRAAIAAGLKTVPAVELLGCSDEAARELQLVENCQRKDVHPMEEAEAYEALMAIYEKGTVYSARLEAVARRVGKPRSMIAKRLKLLALPAAARKAFKDGSLAAETAALIARIPRQEDRERAAKFATTAGESGFDPSRGEYVRGDRTLPPPAVVGTWIRDNLDHALKDCGFDPTDATLVPAAGACGPCPKRVGNQADLFAGAGNADTCTDPTCFQSKVDATWRRAAEQAKSQGKEVLSDAAAKKAFPFGHGRLGDENYVDADQEKYHNGHYVKPRQVVKGQDVKEILARRPDGTVATLYRKAEFEAAANKASKAGKKAESVRNIINGKTNEGLKRRKIELEAKRRLKLALIAKVRDGVKERPYLTAIAHLEVPQAFNSYSPFDKAIWKRYAPAKNRKAILEIKDVNVLRAAILDHALGDPGHNGQGDHHMEAVGAAFGLSLRDFIAQVKADKVKKKGGRK